MNRLWKKLLGNESWTWYRGLWILFLLACIYLSVFCRSKFFGEQTETGIGWDTTADPGWIEDLYPDSVIRQEFYAQDDILNLIYFAVGSHGDTGTMRITLKDETDRVLAVSDLPVTQMVENGAQGVNFNIRVTKGTSYSYEISFLDVQDELPQIQAMPCLSEGELGDLTVDGQVLEQKIYGLFVFQSYYTSSKEWRLCVLLTLLAALFALICPLLPVWNTRLLPLFLAMHAALGVAVLELTAGTSVWELSSRNLLCNIILCFLFFAILSLVLWNGRALLWGGTLVCFILGLAEYYVLEFRGSPLVPADIFSAGTAGEVSSAYHFDVTKEMAIALLLIGFVFLLELRVKFRRPSLRGRLLRWALLLALSCGGWFYLRSLPLLNTGDNGGFFWNLESSYQKYGYLLGTYIYENYQRIDKPESYSEQTVRELVEEYSAGTLSTVHSTESAEEADTLPNIIAIMNESLTDFASVGGIETDIPVMPFIESLEENTVKGNLYVSVFGGGTANTEFEFLTGSTMQFLPRGSTPYQAYVKSGLPSLASWLKQLDYTTIAAHYANRINWNRDSVYPLLGFDAYYSEEDAGEMEEIHGYPSDHANYQEILQKYEDWKQNGETDHFFCFNVTIQNHGGYISGYRSADAPHYDGAGAGDDVDEYLSLLRESDRAFGELVEYFEQEEQPTVILMFGDHWPRLNSKFIQTMTNQADTEDELEKNQNKYVTPYIIWANYDIEEETGGFISANYLGAKLLDSAGVPLNGYQSFLLKTAQEVPVINALGYIDSENQYFDAAELLDENGQQAVEDYAVLQYADLFGKIDGLNEFFGK